MHQRRRRDCADCHRRCRAWPGHSQCRPGGSLRHATRQRVLPAQKWAHGACWQQGARDRHVLTLGEQVPGSNPAAGKGRQGCWGVVGEGRLLGGPYFRWEAELKLGSRVEAWLCRLSVLRSLCDGAPLAQRCMVLNHTKPQHQRLLYGGIHTSHAHVFVCGVCQSCCLPTHCLTDKQTKHTQVKLAGGEIIGAPTPADVMASASRTVLTKLDRVESDVIDFFMPAAARLIAGPHPERVLAAALAAMSGFRCVAVGCAGVCHRLIVAVACTL